MNQTFLILHADDLGFTHGFNEAIRVAHQRGLLTSTCLQVTGFAYREAIREVLPECPRLGIGVHLNLVECRSILPHGAVPKLTRRDGTFRGYGPLLRAAFDREIRRQIRDECSAQIERTLEDGVRLDHLNSHRHAHMLPGFFEIACELAVEYGIPFVRIASERFPRPRPLSSGAYLLRDANWAKMLLMNRLARRNRPILEGFGLRANTAFVGLSYTGYGCEKTLLNLLRASVDRSEGEDVESAEQDRVIEALVHVCIPHHPGDAQLALPPSIRSYCDSAWRTRELEAAMSPAIADLINHSTVQTASYSDLRPPAERLRGRELSPRDQAALLDLLAHPKGPNAALIHAAERVRDRYG